jgi:hypothetical protein
VWCSQASQKAVNTRMQHHHSLHVKKRQEFLYSFYNTTGISSGRTRPWGLLSL